VVEDFLEGMVEGEGERGERTGGRWEGHSFVDYVPKPNEQIIELYKHEINPKITKIYKIQSRIRANKQ
jgi:hypothetical protein